MTFGEELRDMVARCGVTPRWLCERTGIAPGDLDAWFDNRERPSPAMLERLAVGLGISLEGMGAPFEDAPAHHLRGLRDVYRRRRRAFRSHARL